jgi:hypothetical protein
MPDVARLDISRDDGQVQWLVYPDGSWACYQLDDRRVEQGGPRRFWGELQTIYHWWQALGEPGRGRIGLTVLADGAHRVWVEPTSADDAGGVDPTPDD